MAIVIKINAFLGGRWHDLRAALSPAFTSSKMKAMFHFMTESAKQYTDYYLEQDDKVISIELKDSFTRYTNDVIATSAYGVKCNSLKDRNNEFFMLGKEAFNFGGIKSFKFFGYAISPALMKVSTYLFSNYCNVICISRSSLEGNNYV